MFPTKVSIREKRKKTGTLSGSNHEQHLTMYYSDSTKNVIRKTMRKLALVKVIAHEM